jgi:probable phosphoglycerate mutase
VKAEEFYFIRHGQTDHNIFDGRDKGDHPDEVSLNAKGRDQARGIEPVIACLPIQQVCTSPLMRAQETKEIVSVGLQVAHYDMDEFGECTAQIWKGMVGLGLDEPLPENERVRSFVSQVQRGIERVLALPGTSLVVSHGGVHLALCWLLGVVEHGWIIDNCVPVHFVRGADGKWRGRKLSLNDVKQVAQQR